MQPVASPPALTIRGRRRGFGTASRTCSASACGYDDANDADSLRHDTLFMLTRIMGRCVAARPKGRLAGLKIPYKNFYEIPFPASPFREIKGLSGTGSSS